MRSPCEFFRPVTGIGSNSSSVPASALACWGSRSEIRRGEESGVGRNNNRWTHKERKSNNFRKTVAYETSQLTSFRLRGVSRQQAEIIQDGGCGGGSRGERGGGAARRRSGRRRRDEGAAEQGVFCSQRVWKEAAGPTRGSVPGTRQHTTLYRQYVQV